MKHAVKHNPSEEIFVPLIAIENNIDFLMSKSKKSIIFLDGTEKEVKEFKEVNVISKEGSEITKRIYGISSSKFLGLWFNKIEFDSLNFVYINFKK